MTPTLTDGQSLSQTARPLRRLCGSGSGAESRKGTHEAEAEHTIADLSELGEGQAALGIFYEAKDGKYVLDVKGTPRQSDGTGESPLRTPGRADLSRLTPCSLGVGSRPSGRARDKTKPFLLDKISREARGPRMCRYEGRI